MERVSRWSVGDMLEIKLREPADFLKVAETLTRIGIVHENEGNRLYQSCHIFHKKGRYYIVHHTELSALDGRIGVPDPEDIAIRNQVAVLLMEWNLLTILEEVPSGDQLSGMKNLKVVSFREKQSWTLIPMYHIGGKRR